MERSLTKGTVFWTLLTLTNIIQVVRSMTYSTIILGEAFVTGIHAVLTCAIIGVEAS